MSEPNGALTGVYTYKRYATTRPPIPRGHVLPINLTTRVPENHKEEKPLGGFCSCHNRQILEKSLKCLKIGPLSSPLLRENVRQVHINNKKVKNTTPSHRLYRTPWSVKQLRGVWRIPTPKNSQSRYMNDGGEEVMSSLIRVPRWAWLARPAQHSSPSL